MLGIIRPLFAAVLLPAAFAQSSNYSTEGPVRSQVVRLDKLSAGQPYSVLFSLNPADLTASSRVTVAVAAGDHVLVQKTLHAGDADLYGFIRPVQSGDLRITTDNAARRYRLRINPAPFASVAGHTWQ